MQGFASYFADQDTARHAVELCLPMINAAMESREAGASGFLYIVVMKPGFTPAHGSFQDAILYEHAVGDRAKWDADYGMYARGKAEVSWRTGLDSDLARQCKPYLLAEGDSTLCGGVVLHDITVAVSGATVSASPAPNTSIAGSTCPNQDADASTRSSRSRPAALTSGPTVIGSRGPMRPASAPARAENSSMITVIGSSAAPAAMGANPATVCSCSTSSRNTAPIAL